MHRINPRCKLFANGQEADAHIKSLEVVYDHDTAYRLGSMIPDVHYRASELKVSMVVYAILQIRVGPNDIRCELSNGKIYHFYASHIETIRAREGTHMTIKANLVAEEDMHPGGFIENEDLSIETRQVTTGYETPVSESVYGHTWDTLERHVSSRRIIDFAEGGHKVKKVKEETLDDVDKIIGKLKLIVEPILK